jgi:hypothetical protein
MLADSQSRRTGYTTKMLRECLALISELSDYPVMIRTHTAQYAFDLAMQFREMVVTQLGDVIRSVRCEKQGVDTWVIVNDRARFQFVSYSLSARSGRATEYYDIFDDNSTFDLCGSHDYD